MAQLATAALAENANGNRGALVQVRATAPCSNSDAYIGSNGQAVVEESQTSETGRPSRNVGMQDLVPSGAKGLCKNVSAVSW